jgi:hypothetical protein
MEETQKKKKNTEEENGVRDFLDIHQGEGSYFVPFSENENKKKIYMTFYVK